jgi:hypothetical protein
MLRKVVASPLANALALEAVCLLCIALARHVSETSMALTVPTTALVASMPLVGSAWLVARRALITSLGARRVLSLTSSIATIVCGVILGTAMEVGSYELPTAAFVMASAVYVGATSPALRGLQSLSLSSHTFATSSRDVVAALKSNCTTFHRVISEARISSRFIVPDITAPIVRNTGTSIRFSFANASTRGTSVVASTR